MNNFILLLQCQDQKGIVAQVSDFIFRSGGNITSADQYTTCPQDGQFLMRVEFVIDAAGHDKAYLEKGFAQVSLKFRGQYKIFEKKNPLRMGILVSKPDHCLFDILYLWKSQELLATIAFVISNYEGHRELVEQYKIPFYFIPATKQDNKEFEILKLVADTDFLVLARYMLLLSEEFLKKYAKDIINIHHGFLPSFKGAHPYKQALQKGVKVIGATAHFVTEKLDEGPIISQVVEPVSHKDDLDSLVRKGKNLEKRALAEALHNYLDYRVIRHNNKTIVF
jgi:formyltetrahydrofolate deformylase